MNGNNVFFLDIQDEIKRLSYRRSELVNNKSYRLNEELKEAYNRLLQRVINLPNLTLEEKKLLTDEINSKISFIGVYDNLNYNVRTITNLQELRDAIDRIYNEQLYGVGGNFGSLNEIEALNDYNALLEILSEMKDVDVAVVSELKNVLKAKIGQVSIVENQKKQAILEQQKSRQTAYDNARERYSKLNFLEKMRMYRLRQTPNHQDFDSLEIEDIDNLYVGRHK